jgi:lysozyme family protein
MTHLDCLASGDKTKILFALDALWHDLVPRREWDIKAKQEAGTIALVRQTYKLVESSTCVPWWVIGVIHQLEGGGSFKTHLHNGDPLTAYTKNFPKGRPMLGHEPPFTWEESAIDALRYDGLCERRDWTKAAVVLDTLERYNGTGYRPLRIASPYLWSGSHHYFKGKFVKDSKFEADAVSKQVGCALVLKQLERMGMMKLK